MRGLFGGVLALSILQAVLSTTGAAARVGGAGKSVAAVLNHLIDPNVPLIPDLRTK